MPADDPLAGATGGAAMASDDGAPRSPPTPPPPRPVSFSFFFYLAVYVFLLALLLPRLLPSWPWRAFQRDQFIVCGVLNLDPAPGVFVMTSRLESVSPTHRVLILPGLATGAFSFRRLYRSLESRGLHVVVLDLPGQGFSPAPPAARGAARVIQEIMNPGAFQQASSPYAPAQEAAAAVARAAEALGLGVGGGAFHLVLHDSALAAGAAFVAGANPGTVVRSVTLIDATASEEPAFPAAIFSVPVVGKLVLRVPPLFRWLLRRFCARGMGAEDADAHRALMLVKGQARVVEAWKAMNHSFDLAEWRESSEEVRKLPMMVLWSGTWSSRWSSEGKKVAAALPDAKFIHHSGGRWPQEDAPEEISKVITEFVTTFEEAAGGYHLSRSFKGFNPFAAERVNYIFQSSICTSIQFCNLNSKTR
ncbi:hypothetical protein BDA96_05G156700 [Sorghum bicolor]|uniref:AB hydrolase-1 domain-containing protein n=2 Tax=Sorghum bicolor TaxID=4558 RepID=A0A921UFU2_SORBI|nr:protein AUXIN RESPONSE 4 [Sorghum bicolor]KAG0530113.1 hypothetical protein BDA96_05G156700 [Sorghum bicolor]|eukprot:XP_002450898.2 protein AUXIN RESPONSE 4 [Sorghum bicolor]